jgi:LysR family transcriptional regulator, low CO2-responsive transcriptional regulator
VLTLNQLRTFLAVAETGSVRAAAEQLVVTQAAVSASLAAMQRSLGLQLIRPDGRGLRLTSAGEEYAAYAHRVLGLLDEARLAAAAAADPERGELRIAAVTTAAEQIVPGLLSGYRRQHPHTGVLLEAGNRDRVRTLLEHHRVDLALAGRPEPGWDVRVHAVRPHELVVVSAPELAAESVAAGSGPAGAAGASGMLRWLSRQAWLLREPGSGTRLSTEALLAELDITPPTLTVGSNGAIRESAAVGLGVTLVSRDAVAQELASGRLAEVRVPGTPLHRDWYLIAHPGRLPRPAARLVALVLKDSGESGFHPPAPPNGDSAAG